MLNCFPITRPPANLFKAFYVNQGSNRETEPVRDKYLLQGISLRDGGAGWVGQNSELGHSEGQAGILGPGLKLLSAGRLSSSGEL